MNCSTIDDCCPIQFVMCTIPFLVVIGLVVVNMLGPWKND